MNLVTDPWIPVLDISGKPATASLMQVFTEGSGYRDLTVRPHERIALMRLLICIAQASLDGPEKDKEFDSARHALPRAVARYFASPTIREAFELFGAKTPFLQIALLERRAKKPNNNDAEEVGSSNPVSKLDFSLASQNNTTLFDHSANGAGVRRFEAEWIALQLLTFQSFSSSGRIGVAAWGEHSSKGGGSSLAAPCIQKMMLHSFVRRDLLLDTVCANLLTKEQVDMYLKPYSWGNPIWEMFPSSPTDESAINNATETYLGRLVPLSRWIRVDRAGGEMILANGFSYPGHPDRPAEATATEYVKTSKKRDERVLLRVEEKAIWRQLPAILVRYRQSKAGRGPLSLENQTGNRKYDLWVGGMSWSSSGGYEQTVESVLPIDPALQTDIGTQVYEDEVKQCDSVAGRLLAAVAEYRKQLDAELAKVDSETNWRRKRDMEARLNAIAQIHAVRHYWTAIETSLSLLRRRIAVIGRDVSLVQDAQAAWRRRVRLAAKDAYELACAVETPRQVRAFALGWAKLFAPSKAAEATQETETVEAEA